MRFSTKVRYAVRAMVDLGGHASDGVISRVDIAHRQSISADYLAQIFHDLMVAGLVESVKGPHGGYRLTRPTSDVAVGDIVRAVEGPIMVVDCASHHDSVAEIAACPVAWLWQMVSQAVDETVDNITLQMLCQRSEAEKVLVIGEVAPGREVVKTSD